MFLAGQTADAAVHQMQAAGCNIEYNIYDAGHGFYSAQAKPEGVEMLTRECALWTYSAGVDASHDGGILATLVS